VAPASDSAPAPRWAVFLSYAEADQGAIFDIAGVITACGAVVFPDAAWPRSDPESHVLDALSFADEVLILITPTPAESFKTRSTPAFLDRSYVWLAIGVAYARGIPIRGLLKGISRMDVLEDQAIRLIKDGELFEDAESYADDLRRRIKIKRQVITTLAAPHCSVCLCQGGRNVSILRAIEKQLRGAHIVPSRWSAGFLAEHFDAAVVVFGGEASPDWEPTAFVPFLQSFFKAQKPVAFVTPPGQSPALPDWFRPAWWVEYDGSDKLSFLQLVWAIIGYRHYDIDIVEKPPLAKPGIVKPKPGEPLRVFISYSHIDERLRRKLETDLKLLQRQEVIAVWTDRKITAGEEWKGKIDDNLESADIILLLVSADFVDSDYCYGAEMTRALELHDDGKTRVIPVILRDVEWQSAPFGKLQALPKDGKAVMLWRNKDSAWKDVAASIRKVAEQIRSPN
jgi:hypothetical protein